jgi:hypothetical protein
MAEPIEELSARLTSETGEFLDRIEAAFTQGGKLADEFGEKVANAISDERALQAVEQFAERLGISFETAAETLANTAAVGGRSMEELGQAFVAANEQVQQLRPVIDEVLIGVARAAEEAGIKLSDEFVRSVEQTATAIAKAAPSVEQGAQALRHYGQAAAEAARQQAPANRQTEGFGQLIQGQIGGLVSWGARVLAGVTAVKLLTDAIGEINRGVDFVIKLSEAQLHLELRLRGAQRALGDQIGTLESYTALISRLSAAYGVSQIALTETTARAINLGKNLELNQSQVEALVESAAVLSQVTGEDLTGVFQNLSYFLEYGVARGFRRFGLDIEEIERKTGESIATMTQEERVLKVLPLLLEQIGVYQEDVAGTTDNLSVRQQQLNIQWERVRKILGDAVAPTLLTIRENLGNLMEDILGIAIPAIVEFEKVMNQLQALFGLFPIVVAAAMAELRSGEPDIQRFFEAIRWGYANLVEALDQASLGQLTGDVYKLGDALKDVGGDVEEAADAMSEDLREALDKMRGHIRDAEEDLRQGLAMIAQDLEDAIVDIQAEAGRARAKAELDLQRDLRDIDAQAAEDRLQTIIQAQVDEVRLREDHARTLQALENRYLFDLQDAVRERDALRVLQLQRRYNLERQEENGQFQLSLKRLREDTQLRLAEIQRRRALERQQRIVAYQEELADIDAQERLKIEQAQLNAERARRDLERNIRDRLMSLVRALVEEGKLTHEGLERIRREYERLYGPSGWLKYYYDYAAQVIAALGQLQAQAAKYSTSFKSPTTSPSGGGGIYTTSGGQRQMQFGGEFIATQPTLLTVGEGSRPEAVSVQPLSGGRAQDLGPQFGGGRTEIGLEISLDDGLMAQVVDRAMNEVAEVAVSISRNARQGGIAR